MCYKIVQLCVLIGCFLLNKSNANAAVEISGMVHQVWNGNTNEFPYVLYLEGSKYQLEVHHLSGNQTVKTTGFDGEDTYQLDHITQGGRGYEFGHVDVGSRPFGQHGVGDLLWLAFMAKIGPSEESGDLTSKLEDLSFFSVNRSYYGSFYAEIEAGSSADATVSTIMFYTLDTPDVPGFPKSDLSQPAKIGYYEVSEIETFDGVRFPKHFEMIRMIPDYSAPGAEGKILETLSGSVERIRHVEGKDVLPVIESGDVSVFDNRFKAVTGDKVNYRVTDRRWKDRDDSFLKTYVNDLKLQRLARQQSERGPQYVAWIVLGLFVVVPPICFLIFKSRH